MATNISSTTPAAPAGRLNVQWQTDGVNASGNIPAAGTGTVTNTGGALTSHGVVLGAGGNDEKALVSLGTTGQVLTSNGAGADPSWQAAGSGTVTNSGTLTSGQLIIGNGGTSVKTGDLSGDVTTSGSGVTALRAALLVESTGITIDGGGSTPATGSKGFKQVPYSATITGWTLLADQSGSCQITVKKSTYAGFPTTSSIVASAPPVLSSAQKNTSTTLTGWTTTITAGDVLEFNLDSASTLTRVTLQLQLTRT